MEVTILFIPYAVSDVCCILEILKDHVDYPPNHAADTMQDEDIAFFNDGFVHKQNSIPAYVPKDSGDQVNGFMKSSRKSLESQPKCWYVTSLFLRHNASSVQYALNMITQFKSLLIHIFDTCVVVHPAATQIIAFWGI